MQYNIVDIGYYLNTISAFFTFCNKSIVVIENQRSNNNKAITIFFSHPWFFQVSLAGPTTVKEEVSFFWLLTDMLLPPRKIRIAIQRKNEDTTLPTKTTSYGYDIESGGIVPASLSFGRHNAFAIMSAQRVLNVYKDMICCRNDDFAFN
jgi:hypothetical protein